MSSANLIFESNQLLSNAMNSFEDFNVYNSETQVANDDDSNNKKLIDDFSLSMPVINYIEISCNQCNKAIQNYEINIELGEHFYHKDCYKCKCCSENFSLIENQSSLDNKFIPIQDSCGVLYCFNDFIKSLKCAACLKVFDFDSRIIELKMNDANKVSNSDNMLIHTECAMCKSCNSSIKGLEEYVIEKSDDQNLALICKCCSIKRINASKILLEKKSKKVFNSNIRLSSRQKELLASKILAEKIELKKILTEASEIVKYLSNDIKCSKKSLVFYLNKHIKKANEKQSELEIRNSIEAQDETTLQSKSSTFNSLKKNPVSSMLDELNRLDKILAPNKFPFGQLNRQKDQKNV